MSIQTCLKKPNKKPKTNLVHAGRYPHDNHGVVNPPVYHASTILQPSLDAFEAARKSDWKGYRYGRRGTPTTRAFEEAVAAVYEADGCVAVSSGLAAVTNGILACVKPGDHILMLIMFMDLPGALLMVF